MADAATIEEQRMMELEQARLAKEAESQEKTAGKPKSERFINDGEAALWLAFTGLIELIQLALDFLIPFLGWVINVVISGFVGFTFYLWLKGKIAKGAPKKWLKVIYWGAAGGALPVIPGYFGAIIWLIMEDRQFLKKAFGKIGEMAQKAAGKIK